MFYKLPVKTMALLKLDLIFRNRWTTTIRHAESLARAMTTTGMKEDVPLGRQATTGKSVTNYNGLFRQSLDWTGTGEEWVTVCYAEPSHCILCGNLNGTYTLALYQSCTGPSPLST